MLTQAYLSITFINYQKHIWIRKSKGEVITELGTRTKRSPQNSPELELKKQENCYRTTRHVSILFNLISVTYS